MKDDLVFKFFENGKFSGEAFVRVHNSHDFKDVMALNYTRMGHRYIETIDANQIEYDMYYINLKSAKNSNIP
jgi:hypothetical protein